MISIDVERRTANLTVVRELMIRQLSGGQGWNLPNDTNWLLSAMTAVSRYSETYRGPRSVLIGSPMDGMTSIYFTFAETQP